MAEFGERSVNGISQSTRTIRREMRDLAVAGAPDRFQRHLDPQIAATFAVVEHRDRPGRRDLVLIVFGMVINALLDQLLHRHILDAPGTTRMPARSALVSALPDVWTGVKPSET